MKSIVDISLCSALVVAVVTAVITTVAGCDTVAPVDESRLVVEGFLNSGSPLPAVRVRRTLSPNRAFDAADAAVDDATVELTLAGSSVRYAIDSEKPGLYVPESDTVTPQPGETFVFRAVWNGSEARAEGVVPPEVEIVDVEVVVPDEPVSAVLLDSLALSDSISTGLYTGYIYPIEVAVDWKEAHAGGWSESESWIRAQLKPYAAFSSPVVDLFLRSEEIFRESEQEQVDGVQTWTGVYAVGVAEADDPLPEHRLRVSLLRSGPEYARFAASKDAPERREPITNLEGGVGIFAAVAVDSTRLHVASGGAQPHGAVTAAVPVPGREGIVSMDGPPRP